MKRRHPDYSNCERCDYFYADCGDITGTNVYCHYDSIENDDITPCQRETGTKTVTEFVGYDDEGRPVFTSYEIKIER